MTHKEKSKETKERLCASLKKLMTKKSFSKITISEIISDCNVNRKTFYYHFEDIYALLKWMLEQEAIEVIKQFDLLIDYEDALRFTMDYVENNAHILSCAYDSIGRDELKRFFFKDLYAITRNIVDSCAIEKNISLAEDTKEFVCNFLLEGTAGMLVNAFENKQQQKKETAIKNAKCLAEALPDVLIRVSQK